MSTTEHGNNGTNIETVTDDGVGVNLLKRNSDDVGWEYGVLVDAQNKDKVKCKFCSHQSTGGIYRLKQHVANVGKNVKKCRSCTQEAKDKCKKSLDDAKRKREEKTVRELELREDVNISRVGEAMGTDEQLQQRRSARVREMYAEEEFESEQEEFDDEEDDE